jgi:hypothetical protein
MNQEPAVAIRKRNHAFGSGNLCKPVLSKQQVAIAPALVSF